MTQNNKDDSQLGDGYKCSCGFITDDKSKFLQHIGLGNRTDGKGTHKSLGRVNIVTGELTMPPWGQRTEEQRDQSMHGRKALKLGKDGKGTIIRTTDILAQATELKLIPRIYTVTYTPIMQSGFAAAINIFGWREDMPFENFLDTVIYNFFKEHGVKLTGYILSDELVEQLVSANDKQSQGNETDLDDQSSNDQNSGHMTRLEPEDFNQN